MKIFAVLILWWIICHFEGTEWPNSSYSSNLMYTYSHQLNGYASSDLFKANTDPNTNDTIYIGIIKILY